MSTSHAHLSIINPTVRALYIIIGFAYNVVVQESHVANPAIVMLNILYRV